MIHDDRIYIIAATHRQAVMWAERYGFPAGAYKTITLASSLRGMHPASRIVWLASRVEHPDASKIEQELKERKFTNVTYLDENGSIRST